jgi:hypothetical protein
MILSWKTELKEEVITKKNTNNYYDTLWKTDSWDMILSWKKKVITKNNTNKNYHYYDRLSKT